MKKSKFKLKHFSFLFCTILLLIIMIIVITPTKAEDNFLINHIVDGTNPEGAVINMFDYWITDTEIPPILDSDINNMSSNNYYPTGYSIANYPELGINKNHLFLFRISSGAEYGLWNGYARHHLITSPGIVQNNLGSDGYPHLNLYNFSQGPWLPIDQQKNVQLTSNVNVLYPQLTSTRPWTTYKNFKGNTTQTLAAHATALKNNKDGLATESLAYLFDPNIQVTGKSSYTNVQGLFNTDGNGTYYFNSADNYISLEDNITHFNTVQTSPKSGSKLTMYDTSAQLRDGTEYKGTFFPFNKATDIFEAGADGSMQVKNKYSVNNSVAVSGLNHYFGVNMILPFYIPENGVIRKVNPETSEEELEDVVFRFTGDDDVWIFVDDVLILDLGSIHPTVGGNINFTTGVISRTINNRTETISIYEQFVKAGVADKVEWMTRADGSKVFASGTNHTLKMYYMERGNFNSTIDIKFNLLTSIPIDVKKINQDEEPIEGVEFELYKVEGFKTNKKPSEVTLEDVKSYITPNNLISTLTTDELGQGTFKEKTINGDEKIISFSDYYAQGIQFFILKEKSAPNAYKKLTKEIVLRYDNTYQMLAVNNKYETGAYADYDMEIFGNDNISYTTFDNELGTTLFDSNKTLLDSEQKNGLVFVVPLAKSQNSWSPIYGSNLKGFQFIKNETVTTDVNILTAFLYQMLEENSPEWYFYYNEKSNRLEADLKNMPETADRYIFPNKSTTGDMQLSYAIITEQGLKKLGIDSTISEDEKYNAIKNYLLNKVNNGISKEKAIEELAKLLTTSGRFSLVNTNYFARYFSSTIYITNETRELIVRKVDNDGSSVNGAIFSLYESEENANTETNPVATGTTGNVEGEDGMLIFTSKNKNGIGYANIQWNNISVGKKYYLKEISAPEGYIKNETIVPIIIGEQSIYADAGTPNDGISVKAGVKTLAKTMQRYAKETNMDISLRDIKIVAQTQPSNNFELYSWQNTTNSKNLHYNINNMYDYETHEKDGDSFFKTDTGFIRTEVYQNYNYHTSVEDEYYNSAIENKITDNITDMYTIVNIVEVENVRKNRKLSGIAFEDVNHDEKYTEEYDVLFSNIRVSLINQDTHEIEATAITDNKGYYEFNYLQSLKYLIKFELPKGYVVINKNMSDNSNKSNPNGTTDLIEYILPQDEYIEIAHINLGIEVVKFKFTKISQNNKSSPIINEGKFELYKYTCDITDKAYNNLMSQNKDCFEKHGDTISPDENGEVLFNYLDGNYFRLIEVEAPDGYIKPSGEWNISIYGAQIDKIECIGGKCPAFLKDEDNLYLPNQTLESLPVSGGSGRMTITIVGTILIGLAIIIFKKNNSK